MEFLYEDAFRNNPKVFVYYNLHKCIFSIKALSGAYKGKVIAYANKVCLERCVFKVSRAGRKRVLVERRKNVHAGIEGFVCSTDLTHVCDKEVTYNPYVYDSFVYKKSEKQILSSTYCFLIGKQVFVSK